MERQSKNFLALIRGSLHQTPIQLSEPDWDALYELARLHNLIPLVCESARSLPEFASADRRVQSAFLQTTLYQAGMQMTRTEELFRLWDLFEERGLRPLILKGLICRSLYPKPELRGSADEDLWIRKEDLPAYHQLLTEQGYICQDPDANLDTIQEVTYEGPLLELELHLNPFGTDSAERIQMNLLFRDSHERAISMTIQGHDVRTLEPTEHYLFLFVHLYKHFIRGGVGIRQFLDLLLAERAWGESLDWDRIHSAIAGMGAEPLYAAVLATGREYLGFSPVPRLSPEAVPDSSALDGLMEDLMESGAFGNSSRFQRLSAAYIYASTEGKGSPVRRLFLLLFPPAVRLSSRYPFLNRRPWLLPAAWTMRIFRFAKELLLSDHTLVRRSARRGQKRLDVMKKLGIKSDLKNP